LLSVGSDEPARPGIAIVTRAALIPIPISAAGPMRRQGFQP